MSKPLESPPGVELVLVRHGETLWNRAHRWKGSQDIPLSDVGRKQGAALAERLQEESFDLVASSDLLRASETAEILMGPERAKGIHFDPALQEVRMGPFEGILTEELPQRFPEAYRRRILSDDPADFDFALPEMESRNVFNARASQAVQSWAMRAPGKRILVVCHGGVLRSFVCAALGLDWGATRQFEIPNCAYNCLREDRGRWRVVAWGDVSHMGGFVTRPA